MKGLEQRGYETQAEHLARLLAENILVIAALPSDQRYGALRRLLESSVARQRPDRAVEMESGPAAP